MAEVVIVRWPEEGAEGARLAEEGVAVLYLVGANDDPPMPMTCLEDWVRLPGDDRDLHARAWLFWSCVRPRTIRRLMSTSTVVSITGAGSSRCLRTKRNWPQC